MKNETVGLWDRFIRLKDQAIAEVIGIESTKDRGVIQIYFIVESPHIMGPPFVGTLDQFFKEYSIKSKNTPKSLIELSYIGDIVQSIQSKNLYIVQGITHDNVSLVSNNIPSNTIMVPYKEFNTLYTHYNTVDNVRMGLIKALTLAVIDLKIVSYQVNCSSIVYSIKGSSGTLNRIIDHNIGDVLKYEAMLDEIKQLYTSTSVIKDPKNHKYIIGDVVSLGGSKLIFKALIHNEGIYFKDGTIIKNLDILEGCEIASEDYPYDLT